MKNKITKENIKKYRYQIILTVLGLILVFLINYNIVHGLVALPAPFYGGDVYFELGQTQHFLNGGSPLDASNYNGARPHYFITYTILAGGLAKLFSLDAITSHYVLSYILIMASFVAFLLLVNKLFKNYYLALFSSLFFVISFSGPPIIKYTSMAKMVMTPLFLYLFLIFYEKRDIRSGVWLGLFYGIIGLTHSIAFIASSLFMAGTFAYMFYKDYRKEKKKAFFGVWMYALPFAIGFVISLLWWWEPIFVYFGHTANNFSEWTNTFFRFGWQFDFLFSVFKTNLFKFSTLKSTIWSIFNIVGLLGLFTVKGSEKVRKLRLVIAVSFLVTFHYFFTQNFLSFSFTPEYVNGLLLHPSFVLLFTLGVLIALNFIKKLKINFSVGWVKYILTVLVVIFFVLLGQNTVSVIKADQWYSVGESGLAPHFYALQEYFDEGGLSVYDTVLTTKELGFGVNVLTGMKLLTGRWGHSDPFFDLQERERDAAIIFYGNDIELKKELIKKYDIKYFYWDYFWIQSEYYFNDQGQIVGEFDPMLLFYTVQQEEILNKNGVKYNIKEGWVDPTLKGDLYQSYQLIFVSPENYQSQEHPWSFDLDPYLKEVWSFEHNNQIIARLYEIDLDAEIVEPAQVEDEGEVDESGPEGVEEESMTPFSQI